MSRKTEKVMVSLRVERELVDEIDLMVKREGMKSRRELFVRAFEEFREMRTPKHNTMPIKVRMPITTAREMDFLVKAGDQKTWEEIVVRSVEAFVAQRQAYLEDIPRKREAILKALAQDDGHGLNIEV